MLILAVLVEILWIGSVAPNSAAIFSSTGYFAVYHGSFDELPAVLSLGPLAVAPVELHDADDDPPSDFLVSTLGGACVG